MQTYEVPVSSTVRATLIIGAESKEEAAKVAKEQMEESLARLIREAEARGDDATRGPLSGEIVVHKHLIR